MQRTHCISGSETAKTVISALCRSPLSRRSPILLLPRTKGQGSIPFRHFDAGFRNYRAHATVTVLLPLTVSSFAVLLLPFYTDAPVYKPSFLISAAFVRSIRPIFPLQTQKMASAKPKGALYARKYASFALLGAQKPPTASYGSVFATGQAKSQAKADKHYNPLSAPQKSREDSKK